MIHHADDSAWMGRALRLARAAGARGEVPVGAVVVAGGRVIGGGANASIRKCDPTAHAEVVALRRAGSHRRNYRLSGATLYVTLEPCLMCLGAMVHARIGRLVFGARDPKVGALAIYRRRRAGLNHRFPITGAIRAPECADLLQLFFRTRRTRTRPASPTGTRRAPARKSKQR